MLSPSEQKVYDLVIKGFSNRKTAEILGITEKTVKFHLANIFARKQVSNRTELIVSNNGDKNVSIEEINLFRTLMRE
jgi:DNA-binding CsgD family transcriptional regulator